MDISQYIPQSGQLIKIDYMTMALLVVILITVIINIKKGFLKALVSLCVGAGSFILALVFCQAAGAYLYSTGLGTTVYDSIHQWTTTVEGMDTMVNSSNVGDALIVAYNSLGIPSMLHDMLNSIITGLNLVGEADVELGAVISEAMARYILIGASFIVIWLAAFIVFFLLGKLAKGVNKVPLIGPINRILGGVFGIAYGLIICAAISYAVVYLASMNDTFFNTIADLIAYYDDSIWTLPKTLFNIINDLVATFIA